MLHDVADEEGLLTEEQAMALMRLAYGKGYVDASRQDDWETAKRLGLALELINPETGEMC